MLIDSHCHLDTSVYPDGPGPALERARAAGVGAFVAIGVADTLQAAREVVELARTIPDVWASIGLHPHDAKVWTEELWAELALLARSERVVAFGEIGLDYHYMSSPKEQQQDVFRRGIGMARELGLPIVVHTRYAADDTIDILTEEGAKDVGGIIHCFSEDVAFARRALDLGFDLSFSGILTFKNAKPIQEAAAFAPLDRIMVETDSPYLAPMPFRGKKCEPAMVVHTAKRMAELRGIDVAEVARATTENATRRLKIAPPAA